MATLGEILREKRKGRGLALRKVAQELDISFSNLSVLERDKRPNPSIKILAKLASFYEIPLESLLSKNELNLEETNTTLKPNKSDSVYNKLPNQRIVNYLATSVGEQLVNHITKFSNSINKKINEPSEKVKGDFFSGSLHGISFCITLTELMVYLKADKPIDEIKILISNYFGKPIAYIEQTEGCINKVSKVQALLWLTPICSATHARQILFQLINSHTTINFEIYERSLKELINSPIL